MTMIKSLSKPAPRAWLQGEVAKTLVHYFQGAIPQNFTESIGADYNAELSEFPAWAIVKARRWWLSRENEFRHRKPLPGDLGARCKLEMGPVAYGAAAVARFDRAGLPNPQNEAREPVSAAEMEARRVGANAILAEMGYIKKAQAN